MLLTFHARRSLKLAVAIMLKPCVACKAKILPHFRKVSAPAPPVRPVLGIEINPVIARAALEGIGARVGMVFPYVGRGLVIRVFVIVTPQIVIAVTTDQLGRARGDQGVVAAPRPRCLRRQQRRILRHGHPRMYNHSP